jgi:hypothetical protein
MSQHEIRVTSPVSCPKCGMGHLLAFVIPHFEGEGTYQYGPERHGPFSYYEIIYYCSQHRRFLQGGSCDYEAAL